MPYWDVSSYRRGPTIIPDIRAHSAMWRRFRVATGRWPKLSIIAYVMRFAGMLACIVASFWYGVKHGLKRGEEGLLVLAISAPFIVIWFLLEIRIWNYELRRSGISSSRDTWDTDQFPSG